MNNQDFQRDNSNTVSVVSLRNAALTLPSTHGPVPILHGIDLDVGQGETIAITGPSGSGKTSMLMLIAGLEAPTSGEITVCGENITSWTEDKLASFRAANIGIVFQSFHLIPTMTALENVSIPLEFAGHTDARERASAALQALGLGHRLDHYPSQLSGGEQQRVAIGRAFVMRPKLLLADEPTGNLDQDTGTQVIDLLFSMQRDYGTTLFLITHDPQLAARCGRTIHISDGRIA